MKKIGFIDYYLDEWHANQYPGWIKDASGGAMEVAFAYAVKDAEHGLTNWEWCAQHGVMWCDTIEEVIAQSDYLIVLSPDNPEQHEALAELPLASGKPTYVDKTFAPDRAAALRLFERAAQHHTPLYSSSALRYADEYGEIERAEIRVISSLGPGSFENYSIHQIEPIVALMGTDAKRVMFVGTEAVPALLIEFAGGRQATIQQPGQGCPFMMAVNYDSGTCRVVQPASDYFQRFIQDLVTFFETGQASVPPAETVAIMSIIENGQIAAKQPYRWIDLPESR